MTAHPDDHLPDRLNLGLGRYAERQAQLLATVGDLRPVSHRYATRVASHRPPSMFDDLISSITASSGPVVPKVQPPRSRYMVRVAKVGRPHRPTRRNYDYFDELKAKLAVQRASEDPTTFGS